MVSRSKSEPCRLVAEPARDVLNPGRYSTAPTPDVFSALIQNFFSAETAPYPAVHVTVDVSAEGNEEGLGAKGWVRCVRTLSTSFELAPELNPSLSVIVQLAGWHHPERVLLFPPDPAFARRLKRAALDPALSGLGRAFGNDAAVGA